VPVVDLKESELEEGHKGDVPHWRAPADWHIRDCE